MRSPATRSRLQIPFCCIAGLVVALALAGPAHAHGVTRYDNGRWFDGTTFVEATFFSVEGKLVVGHAGEVDRTVDLHGGFVVPPLADAHTHALADVRFAEAQAEFLAAGVFYAANPNSIRSQTDPVRVDAAKPETVDVTYANGGLTSSGGHPIQIYDRAADHTPGIERDYMAGQAYFAIDGGTQLDLAWPRILDGKPDFLKVYLENAEHHDARKGRHEFYGKRGIDPALLPRIVERAHRSGLRVAVHVTSAFDFRTTVEAGADEIAHLPLERIDEETARLAAERGTTVVTTTLSHRPSSVKQLQEVHRANLGLLERHGVRIVIGTDSDRGVLAELRNVAELMSLSNMSAIELATRTTPRWIFPDRQIGSLESRYEASFLVLGGNPLEDLSAFEQVHLRVKGGHSIEIEPRNEKPSIARALMHTLMSAGPDTAIAEYRRLRHEDPDAYDFSEQQLNGLGYALIQHDQLDAAIAIFELNVEMFPDGSNPYDSLGEALLAAGRREDATRNFRTSLELNPENQSAKEKLRELTSSGQPGAEPLAVMNTNEAAAVLSILENRAAGLRIAESDWDRLFETGPYIRLKKREAEMKREFTDEEFREFVLSDDLVANAENLAGTLEKWASVDLSSPIGKAMAYLPEGSTIRAKVYPVIKPMTNSFVFEITTDPAIFMYLDPEVTPDKLANTLAHEFHHIGFGGNCPSEATKREIDALPDKTAWIAWRLRAFGEGFAMLAAAGGPKVHPHEVSPEEERNRWDDDMSRFEEDLRKVETFVAGSVDGSLADEEKQKIFRSFYGEQGPWYTVGWKMAVTIEEQLGRQALLDAFCDPRELLATYNRAAAKQNQLGEERLPLWTEAVVDAIRGRR